MHVPAATYPDDPRTISCGFRPYGVCVYTVLDDQEWLLVTSGLGRLLGMAAPWRGTIASRRVREHLGALGVDLDRLVRRRVHRAGGSGYGPTSGEHWLVAVADLIAAVPAGPLGDRLQGCVRALRRFWAEGRGYPLRIDLRIDLEDRALPADGQPPAPPDPAAPEPLPEPVPEAPAEPAAMAPASAAGFDRRRYAAQATAHVLLVFQLSKTLATMGEAVRTLWQGFSELDPITNKQTAFYEGPFREIYQAYCQLEEQQAAASQTPEVEAALALYAHLQRLRAQPFSLAVLHEWDAYLTVA